MGARSERTAITYRFSVEPMSSVIGDCDAFDQALVDVAVDLYLADHPELLPQAGHPNNGVHDALVSCTRSAPAASYQPLVPEYSPMEKAWLGEEMTA